MNIIITISTNKTAFNDEPAREVGRILYALGRLYMAAQSGAEPWPTPLYAENGEKVGTVEVRQ